MGLMHLAAQVDEQVNAVSILILFTPVLCPFYTAQNLLYREIYVFAMWRQCNPEVKFLRGVCLCVARGRPRRGRGWRGVIGQPPDASSCPSG